MFKNDFKVVSYKRKNRSNKHKKNNTPEDNDVMAFIDDDLSFDENKQMERRTSTSSMSLSSHFQNGWSTPTSQLKRLKKENSVTVSTPALFDNNNESKKHVPENTAGHGSPLRSSLNLQLKPHATFKKPVQECPMCPFSSDNLLKLEEHINRQHFDLTSPSVSVESSKEIAENKTFNCPLCVIGFSKSSDLELHVNIEHKDILSPANNKSSRSAISNREKETPTCPICFCKSFKNSEELIIHTEEHFSRKELSPITPDVSSDRLLAKDIERHEKEARKIQEQKEFAMLQAQYGMDNQGNFREQSVTNMQKAVFAGEMSVADYYEKQIELKIAENKGIDDGSSCTKGLIPKIRSISQASSNVINTWMCSTVDHYGVTYGDKGWGCGYRNTQMLISSLLHHTRYNELVYKIWSLGGSSSFSDNPSRFSVPSISKIQKMIEWAWGQGFDVQGAEQLGTKLVSTRKWIGATEVVTFLSSLKIKCQLLDFHRPTSPNGGHPEMFKWVLEYFQKFDDFKPPLYLQHQGHSRTIMGVELLRNGSVVMLVLDPSHSPSQMAQFNNSSNATSAMRYIRVSAAALKAKQYQVVSVVGTLDTESQYQQSKVLCSLRIPPER